MARLGRRGDQGLDLGQAGRVAAVLARDIHHDEELPPALVQRQHLELVAGRQHGRTHHGVAHHGVEQLAPLHALVLAVGGVLGGRHVELGLAVAPGHQGHGGLGVEHSRWLHGPGPGRRALAREPTEQ